MKYRLPLVGALVALSSPVMAQTAPIITVVPTLAPNAYGSPSWNAWIANSNTAGHLQKPSQNRL